MIKLTNENTQNPIAKCKQLRPKVIFIAGATANIYRQGLKRQAA